MNKCTLQYHRPSVANLLSQVFIAGMVFDQSDVVDVVVRQLDEVVDLLLRRMMVHQSDVVDVVVGLLLRVVVHQLDEVIYRKLHLGMRRPL